MARRAISGGVAALAAIATMLATPAAAQSTSPTLNGKSQDVAMESVELAFERLELE